MTFDSLKCWRVLSAVVMRSNDREKFSVSTSESIAASKICIFLEFAAQATKVHIDRSYVNYSLVDLIFTKLGNLYDTNIKGAIAELSSIASKLKKNIFHCEPYLRSLRTHFGRAAGPCLGNDVLQGGQKIWEIVTLSFSNEITDDVEKYLSSHERSAIYKILDETGCGYLGDDAVVKILRVRTRVDRSASALDWWKVNSGRFHSVSVASKDV